jgi:preprotein translocase subunit SecG
VSYKNKLMKKFILFIALAFILILIGYTYVYKADRNISEEQPKFTIASTLLKQELNANQVNVINKYLNETIEISGLATQIEMNTIILDNFVSARLDTLHTSINIGDALIVKGRVIGYDELLEELKLDQCTVAIKQ